MAVYKESSKIVIGTYKTNQFNKNLTMLIFPKYTIVIGKFLFWSFIFVMPNAFAVSGKLPGLSLISTIFTVFLKPYLKPQQTAFRVSEGVVEKIVRQKVEELKPFLQDDDFDIPDKENRFTFEGNEETTIIEFVPQNDKDTKTDLRIANDTFKANMQRYKKIRNKINRALEQESVSDKTKTLVMKTLDELISKMIETQCNWKGGGNFDAPNIDNRVIIPRVIVDTWDKEWQKFKTQFSNAVNNRAIDQPTNFKNLLSNLNSLNIIINEVSNNFATLSNRYTINCNVTERKHSKINTLLNDENPNAMRDVLSKEEIGRGNNVCERFKVCSQELKGFFVNFYQLLNDTTVNVLRNYGEMFNRDVYTVGSNEKHSIVSLIFNIGAAIEKAVFKLYVNDTSRFKLDENKSIEANINIFTTYISAVIRHVEVQFKRVLEKQLKHVPGKISSGIQQDVTVNLGIELGNLERDLTGKICYIFNVCNGKHKSRRLDAFNKASNADNVNRIYVQVELTLEPESYEKSKNNSLITVNLDKRYSKDHNSFNSKITTKMIDLKKYANVTVTRTTRA